MSFCRNEALSNLGSWLALEMASRTHQANISQSSSPLSAWSSSILSFGMKGGIMVRVDVTHEKREQSRIISSGRFMMS